MSAIANWIAAGKAAPIAYFPMTDPTTAHINLGTGGNMTLNGTIARSGRGPNQFNVPYSDLDGAANYLSKNSGLTGITDGKAFTLSFCMNRDSSASNNTIIALSSVGSLRLRLVHFGASGYTRLQAYNSSNTEILNADFPVNTFLELRNYAVQLSLDLSDTGKRHAYVNGSSVSMTWTTYTNDTIDFDATTPRVGVGVNFSGGSPTDYFNGRLGNVFFDTRYIDLSVPANLAKFVTGTGIDAKPADMGANGELPLGTTPLIYLPMYGNNAGKNYGSGGDFTVNSGPYPGARGPNEYWGNKADFDGSTGYLAKTTALTGISSTKTMSLSFFCRFDTPSTNMDMLTLMNESNGYFVRVVRNSSDQLSVQAWNSSLTQILQLTYAVGVSTDLFVQISLDLANTSNRSMYVNGASVSPTWSIYTNDTIAYASTTRSTFGAKYNGSSYTTFLDGRLAEFYFTTSYIDFSQEANRLLFRDAFGSPVALLPQIESGAIPNPAIYCRFDPADQGRNDGTGGGFTKSGTILDAGQLG